MLDPGGTRRYQPSIVLSFGLCPLKVIKHNPNRAEMIDPMECATANVLKVILEYLAGRSVLHNTNNI